VNPSVKVHPHQWEALACIVWHGHPKSNVPMNDHSFSYKNDQWIGGVGCIGMEHFMGVQHIGLLVLLDVGPDNLNN